MKNSAKRTSLLLSAALAAGVLTAYAKSSPTFDIHTSVISKASQSEKGVILVLTEPGEIAAEAAYLLLAQIEQNRGYAPLLLAVEQEKIPGYKSALNLPEASLPAVLFFNKSGKEIARVVSAKSAMSKYANAQVHVI